MRIIVFTGAGISKSSGIKVSQEDNGAWENEKWKEYSTPEAWDNNPQKVLDFYNWRRLQLEICKPNMAHRFLASLQEKHDVHIITQNIDDLHERAGSMHVLHIHGELTKVRPEDTFNNLDGYNTQYIYDIGYKEIHMGECGGPNNTQLRPHILFFGEEMPNEYKEAQDLIYGNRNIDVCKHTDVLLVIGTSLRVEPASSLIQLATDGNFCPTYIIDPRDSSADKLKHAIHIKQEAYDGLMEWYNTYSEKDEYYTSHADPIVPSKPFSLFKHFPPKRMEF